MLLFRFTNDKETFMIYIAFSVFNIIFFIFIFHLSQFYVHHRHGTIKILSQMHDHIYHLLTIAHTDTDIHSLFVVKLSLFVELISVSLFCLLHPSNQLTTELKKNSFGYFLAQFTVRINRPPRSSVRCTMATSMIHLRMSLRRHWKLKSNTS